MLKELRLVAWPSIWDSIWCIPDLLTSATMLALLISIRGAQSLKDHRMIALQT